MNLRFNWLKIFYFLVKLTFRKSNLMIIFELQRSNLIFYPQLINKNLIMAIIFDTKSIFLAEWLITQYI